MEKDHRDEPPRVRGPQFRSRLLRNPGVHRGLLVLDPVEELSSVRGILDERAAGDSRGDDRGQTIPAHRSENRIGAPRPGGPGQSDGTLGTGLRLNPDGLNGGIGLESQGGFLAEDRAFGMTHTDRVEPEVVSGNLSDPQLLAGGPGQWLPIEAPLITQGTGSLGGNPKQGTPSVGHLEGPRLAGDGDERRIFRLGIQRLNPEGNPRQAQVIDPPSAHGAVIARDSDIGVPVPIRDQSNPKLGLVGDFGNGGKIDREAIGKGGASVQGEGGSGLQGLPIGGIEHLKAATGRAGGPNIEPQHHGLETHCGSGDFETRGPGTGALLGKAGELQGRVGVGGGITRSYARSRSHAETTQDHQCGRASGGTQKVVGLVEIPESNGQLGPQQTGDDWDRGQQEREDSGDVLQFHRSGCCG